MQLLQWTPGAGGPTGAGGRTPGAGGSQSALKVLPWGSQPSSMVSSPAAFYTLSFENL